VNLAHLLLESAASDRFQRAHAAATSALYLTTGHELERAGFAELGLKARRILRTVIGQWLVETDEVNRRTALTAQAGDVVDSGLSLARRWEALGAIQFRPLALRLFRFGTAYYRRHQPQFLADFVLENVDPTHTSDAFAGETEFLVLAREVLRITRTELHRGFPLIMDEPVTKRRLQTLRNLDEAIERLQKITRHSTATSVKPIS